MFSWWRDAPRDARRALIAAAMGWMLDAFDVMLYALVLVPLMADLGISKTMGGQLGSLALLSAAAGGMLFGIVADRFGRTKALMGSILLYSIFTAACGLAQNALQLALFRVGLGLGMGGEWASGATLVSETWPSEHRGKALGLMQSSWAIGYAAAYLANWLVMPIWGWRGVFLIGVLPALFTIWVRRYVKEPELWHVSRQRSTASHGRVRLIFAPQWRTQTLALTFMNACTMFAWWGFNLWIPSYLMLPRAESGVGLDPNAVVRLGLVMQAGMWFGYVSFGFIADSFGRKRTYIAYLLAAAVFMFLYTTTDHPILLLVLGPFVAFFGTGHFSGFGAVSAEIYPTDIRGTAQGFTYNIGRIASALAPTWVGSLAQTRGFGAAFMLAAGAFALASVAWIWIPETQGKELDAPSQLLGLE
jgi:MFS family permease